MSRAWMGERERGAAPLVRFMRWMALRGGRRRARGLLYPITLYFLLAASGPRRASRAYLGRVFGRPARLVEIARHIHCFSATILDRVYFLSGRAEALEIQWHGVEHLEALRERGQGALLIGAHLGSFEALRAPGVRWGQVRVLMYPQHNRVVSELLDALNPEVAASVIPLGGFDSLLRVRETVDEGGFVGILGDRVAQSDKQLPVRFLGGKAVFPAGPMILAATLGVPAYLVFGLYRGGARYDLIVEPFTDGTRVPRAGREHWVREQLAQYVARLEHHVRAAPYNWFNFYDFWNDFTKGRPVRGRIDGAAEHVGVGRDTG